MIITLSHPIAQAALALLSSNDDRWYVQGIDGDYVRHPSGLSVWGDERGTEGPPSIIIFSGDTLMRIDLPTWGIWNNWTNRDPNHPLLVAYGRVRAQCVARCLSSTLNRFQPAPGRPPS